MPVEGRGPGSGTLTERATGEGDWHEPINSNQDPGAPEEALPQGQAGKGVLTCACLVVNPVREPGALVAHAGFDERSQETWYGYLSLIHISEPTRLGMISYAVF